jgi:hypothetical protein
MKKALLHISVLLSVLAVGGVSQQDIDDFRALMLE